MHHGDSPARWHLNGSCHCHEEGGDFRGGEGGAGREPSRRAGQKGREIGEGVYVMEMNSVVTHLAGGTETTTAVVRICAAEAGNQGI